MRISDWSSDVCSSDLTEAQIFGGDLVEKISEQRSVVARDRPQGQAQPRSGHHLGEGRDIGHTITSSSMLVHTERSEEHTSELQSLMRISYAVFCLKKKILRVAYIIEITVRENMLIILTLSRH